MVPVVIGPPPKKKNRLTGLGKNGVLQEAASLAEDEILGRIGDGAGCPPGTVQHPSTTLYRSHGTEVGESAPGDGPTQ